MTLRLLRRLAIRLMTMSAPKRTIHGVLIVDYSTGASDADFGRVADAIGLIHGAGSPWKDRMGKAGKPVVIVDDMEEVGYNTATGLIVLSIDSIRRMSIERTAIALVHAAALADLMDRGFSYRESVRERVQAVCVRRAVGFARMTAPDSDLEAAVLRAHAADRFSDSDMRERYLGSLTASGAPRWILWLVGRYFRGPR